MIRYSPAAPAVKLMLYVPSFRSSITLVLALGPRTLASTRAPPRSRVLPSLSTAISAKVYRVRPRVERLCRDRLSSACARTRCNLSSETNAEAASRAREKERKGAGSNRTWAWQLLVFLSCAMEVGAHAVSIQPRLPIAVAPPRSKIFLDLQLDQQQPEDSTAPAELQDAQADDLPVLPGLQVCRRLQLWNAATLIWGSQHPIIKDVVADASPSSTNAARFCIAAAASLPFLPGAPWRATAEGRDPELTANTWSAGFELGCWSFLGFALQAIGLQFTTASRSAFLLYLNVKLVPLLMSLLLYGRQSPLRAMSAVCRPRRSLARLCSLATAARPTLATCGASPRRSPPPVSSHGLRRRPRPRPSRRSSTRRRSCAPAALTSAWAAAELYLVPEGGGGRTAAASSRPRSA